MIVEEYRGSLLENLHDGRICVIDSFSRVIGAHGDVNAFTYYRSAAKPFQLLPLFMRGLDAKYALSNEELTVCAASHLGEDIHINALESLLSKTDIKEEELLVLPTLPGHKSSRERLIREGLPPRRLYHNCAGKHIALMLLQRELTGSTKDYWQLQSPVQKEILSTIATVSDFPKEQIICGTDGCGVPVFAVPLRSIASAYLKLAHPATVNNDSLALSLTRMNNCINQHPYMISGHGSLCGELNTLSNIVAKGGAEGVYGIGLKEERIGIALKIADGSALCWPLVIAEILRQLGYDHQPTFDLLNSLKSPDKLNDNNEKIGYYKTTFKLFS